MGDPRKTRKKYETPKHPWNKARIDSEKALVKEYGFRRKKEIYKMGSLLKAYKDRAKDLIPKQSVQADLLRNQLRSKLITLGLISEESQISEILGIEIEELMNRRLDSILVKKGLARSPLQARQFITHGHVLVSEKPITSPCYLVSTEQESQVIFRARSSLYSMDHPERMQPEEIAKRIEEKENEEKQAASSEKDQKKSSYPKKRYQKKTTHPKKAETKEIKSKEVVAQEEIPVTVEEIKAKQEEAEQHKTHTVETEVKEELEKETEKGIKEEIEKEEGKRVNTPPEKENPKEVNEDAA
ncbi:30S ribosomal protein S4 [Candidatus Woesearchaeota archaeon]|nr:30S ribosomal protein S4 [Candidatus Woesearchaeota archaeon]|tara:strand:+ start:1154 stop:2050 length:897 start_codon:yes stop_codon:yes gene_type:complete